MAVPRGTATPSPRQSQSMSLRTAVEHLAKKRSITGRERLSEVGQRGVPILRARQGFQNQARDVVLSRGGRSKGAEPPPLGLLEKSLGAQARQDRQNRCVGVVGKMLTDLADGHGRRRGRPHHFHHVALKVAESQCTPRVLPDFIVLPPCANYLALKLRIVLRSTTERSLGVTE